MSLQGIRGRVKNAGIVMSVAVGMFMLVMTAFVPVNAEGTRDITITPENYDGGKAIQEALDEQKGGKDVYEGPAYDLLTITLTPGTYTITESLLIYDNTRLEASGATVNYSGKNSTGTGSRVKQPLLSNYCSGRGGYTGASNISVNGGDWDFQGREGEVNYEYSCEAFRFMHGSNFTFSNLVMTHLYESHYITIEGVENVNITGCTFKNQTNIDAKKEAIHIDCMNNPSIAPSNQDNTIYDDTYCNNITVDGCAFISVPRGVGTHIAVKGIYPSNINITNNLFEKITYEAVKAYHY